MSPRDESRPGPALEDGGEPPERAGRPRYPETAGSLLARRIRADERGLSERPTDPLGVPPPEEI